MTKDGGAEGGKEDGQPVNAASHVRDDEDGADVGTEARRGVLAADTVNGKMSGKEKEEAGGHGQYRSEELYLAEKTYSMNCDGGEKGRRVDKAEQRMRRGKGREKRCERGVSSVEDTQEGEEETYLIRVGQRWPYRHGNAGECAKYVGKAHLNFVDVCSGVRWTRRSRRRSVRKCYGSC